MSKCILSYLLGAFLLLCGFNEPEIQLNIFNGLKSCDSKVIVKHFSSRVNLSLKGNEIISNKFQSERLLSDFLKDNRIAAIETTGSGGNKQGSTYVVYEIKTAKEDLQVIVKFMEIKGEASVVEFKVY